jgi:hypothetical protein
MVRCLALKYNIKFYVISSGVYIYIYIYIYIYYICYLLLFDIQCVQYVNCM